MSDSSDDNAPDGDTEFPDADNGFDEPGEETKRRNWITAGIIVAFVIAWVLFGLRKSLF